MTKELCGACADIMSADCDLQKVPSGKDTKVTCTHCGRRRYGGTYIIQLKEVQRLSKTEYAIAVLKLGQASGLSTDVIAMILADLSDKI